MINVTGAEEMCVYRWPSICMVAAAGVVVVVCLRCLCAVAFISFVPEWFERAVHPDNLPLCALDFAGPTMVAACVHFQWFPLWAETKEHSPPTDHRLRSQWHH